MSQTENLTEDQYSTGKEFILWDSFKQGQNWAFKKIYSDNYDSLFYYGMRFLSSESESKDLIQDFFIRLWTRRKRLPRVRNIKAYLFVSFRALLIDYSKSNIKKVMGSRSLSENLVFSITIEQQLIKDETDTELAHQLSIALKSLSEREREVIYLRFFQGADFKEIARIMDIRYQSVRNLAHKALQKLREFF